MIFAGGTVCIALLGLLLLGVSYFYGLAVGVVIAVLLTMLAAQSFDPRLIWEPSNE